MSTIADFMLLYIGVAVATIKGIRWESYCRIGDKTMLLRIIYCVFRRKSPPLYHERRSVNLLLSLLRGFIS